MAQIQQEIEENLGSNSRTVDFTKMFFETIFVHYEKGKILRINRLTPLGHKLFKYFDLADYLKLKLVCRGVKRCLDVPILIGESNPNESANLPNIMEPQDISHFFQFDPLMHLASQEAIMTICPQVMQTYQQASLHSQITSQSNDPKQNEGTFYVESAFKSLRSEKMTHKQIICTRYNFMKQYKKLKLVPKRQMNQPPSSTDIEVFQSNFCNQHLRQSNIFEKQAFSKSATKQRKTSWLPIHIYHDFVDRYVVQNIRAPQTPLPINIIENEMQMALQTRLQEYVYMQAKENFRNRQQTSKRQKVQQIEHLLNTLELNEPATEKVNSQYLIVQYLIQNESRIVSDLRKKENDSLFKHFYHIRWFQVSNQRKDKEQLQRLYKSLMQNAAGFGSDQALKILIHLLTGIANIFEEYCDFALQLLEQKMAASGSKVSGDHQQQRYTLLLQMYVQFWNNYSTAIVNIDQNLNSVNKLINVLYQRLEPDDDEEEDHQLFSILRWALQIWHRKVYHAIHRQLYKAMKQQIRSWLNMQNQGADQVSQKAALINKVKHSLMDLSLNFNTVHFVEHSSFLDLTGLQAARHEEILGSNTACSEGTLDSQIADDKIERDEKLLNQPWLIYKNLMIDQCKDYCSNISSEEPLDQIKAWFLNMDQSHFFEQSQGLKKIILYEVCAIFFQPIKDIVNKQQERFQKKLQQKQENQADKKKDQNQQKQPIYKGYFGKYLEDKDIARDVQKSFIRKNLITEQQITLFNTLSIEYRNLKHLVLQKDLRIVQIQKDKVEFDRDLINLVIEPQDFGSIETDANQNIICREKMSLRLEKQSKSNSFIIDTQGRSAANLFGASSSLISGGVNETRQRSQGGGQRFSLVPYDQYRNSLIQVGRESKNMSQASQRRSQLFETFNGAVDSSTIDPTVKELKVDTDKLLDFFSYTSNNGD